MTDAMRRLAEQAHPAFPVTIYYAFKQSETTGKEGTSSTGWETFLDAVIRTGFALSGTWPMRTELGNRMRSTDSNALASSIVLVCRKQPESAPTATRRDFLNQLKAELPDALRHLQRGNIAPVDLAQAAIGPGMAVYTRYARVLDAAGTPLSVREALALINQTLDEVLAEQEGDFDADTRWALAWFEQFGFDAGDFGQADVLARATSPGDRLRELFNRYGPCLIPIDEWVAYEQRMRSAYPIHPELFDQLFNQWSTLDRFQRTRGVLRLMASVIHHLWERQDGNLLILPSSVPIDAGPVQSELTNYLEENWLPVIEHDVDGPQSLPLQQDRDNPNLGRYSASRRVARTLFMGSAPTLHSANKGMDDRQIKLGCVQPGESVATYGDALRRLTDRATHLYVDGSRYWFSTQPSVTRVAQDRAVRFKTDEVREEMRRRVRDDLKARGDFAGVHAVPSSSGDVPDEREARLVVLGPEHEHSAKDESSPARIEARDILDHRGGSPRNFRNTLLFLAPDRARLGELDLAIRQYLAWKSIEAEKDELNLDTFQRGQARTQRERAEEAVKARIPETYIWLLAPEQPDKTAGIEWREIRLQGSDPLAVRASKRARNDELLITRYAGTLLRMQLDTVPLWKGNHVSVKQLAEYFAQYPYLPRLRDTDVLLEAIRDGLGQLSWRSDTFAYAQSHDEASGRFLGLKAGEITDVVLGSASVLVKPDVAAEQLAADRAKQEGGTADAGPARDPQPGGGNAGVAEKDPLGDEEAGTVRVQSLPRRFHGSVTLDSTRAGRDAGQIAEEVIQHLTALMGADVEVTLEIQARVPDGVPENVMRTVLENCRTLKFDSHEFEDE